jgi:predicted nucleotidyltransferase component of viral defense system
VTSPLEPSRYANAAAFHAALEARLRRAAGGDPHRLNVMRVQFAIGRLLARLGMAQPQQWIAKGGTSLLARFDGRCRLSRDLDLQRRDLQEIGMSALTDAAAVDGADWLTYRIGQPSALRQVDVFGLKVRATALLDRRDFATFDVDMVEEAAPIGRVERRRPYLPFEVAGAPAPEVPLYPVEDHVADKVAAMGKVRRYGDAVVTSTRYRDLADLALLAASVMMEAAPLRAALAAPARRWAREAFGEAGLRLPSPEWPDRYAAMMRGEPYVVDRWPTADVALAVAKPLVDPALAGDARGTWDPASATWVTG